MPKIFIDELRAAHPLYMYSEYCDMYKERHDDCENCESSIGCLKYLVLIKAYDFFNRHNPNKKHLFPMISKRLSEMIIKASMDQVLNLEGWLDEQG